MKTYSTKQVAEKVGVHRVTLQGWCLEGKIKEPRRLKGGGMDVRIWNDKDIERVLDYKTKYYCKGRGRPKPSARKSRASRKK